MGPKNARDSNRVLADLAKSIRRECAAAAVAAADPEIAAAASPFGAQQGGGPSGPGSLAGSRAGSKAGTPASSRPGSRGGGRVPVVAPRLDAMVWLVANLSGLAAGRAFAK